MNYVEKIKMLTGSENNKHKYTSFAEGIYFDYTWYTRDCVSKKDK